MGTITDSIGTTGRDYSTIQAWEDALPANLVTDGNSYVGECYNDSEFAPAGQLAISGQTTDSTHTITLKCAAGESFTDNADRLTNELRYDQANGVGVLLAGVFVGTAFDISTQYTTVDGLQFRSTYASYTGGMITVAVANCTVKNCIGRYTATGNSVGIFRTTAASNFINVVAILDGTVTAQGFKPESTGAVINCTALYMGSGTGTRGYSRDYGSPLIRNCTAFGFAKFGRDTTADAGSGYNATDLASGDTPGSNNVYSLTTADQFENVTAGTEDLRVKTGSGLVAGTRDQTYTADLDIVGSARSTTTPTIGAWEFGASGASFQAAWAVNSNQIMQTGVGL